MPLNFDFSTSIDSAKKFISFDFSRNEQGLSFLNLVKKFISTTRNNLTFKIIFTCTWHIYLYLAYFGNILAHIQLALYILFPPVTTFVICSFILLCFRLPIFQTIWTQIRMLTKNSLIRPRGYKTFFSAQCKN